MDFNFRRMSQERAHPLQCVRPPKAVHGKPPSQPPPLPPFQYKPVKARRHSAERDRLPLRMPGLQVQRIRQDTMPNTVPMAHPPHELPRRISMRRDPSHRATMPINTSHPGGPLGWLNGPGHRKPPHTARPHILEARPPPAATRPRDQISVATPGDFTNPVTVRRLTQKDIDNSDRSLILESDASIFFDSESKPTTARSDPGPDPFWELPGRHVYQELQEQGNLAFPEAPVPTQSQPNLGAPEEIKHAYHKHVNKSFVEGRMFYENKIRDLKFRKEGAANVRTFRALLAEKVKRVAPDLVVYHYGTNIRPGLDDPMPHQVDLVIRKATPLRWMDWSVVVEDNCFLRSFTKVKKTFEQIMAAEKKDRERNEILKETETDADKMVYSFVQAQPDEAGKSEDPLLGKQNGLLRQVVGHTLFTLVEKMADGEAKKEDITTLLEVIGIYPKLRSCYKFQQPACGTTGLMLLCAMGECQLAGEFIERMNPNDVFVQDWEGLNCFHFAAYYGKLAVLQTLFSKTNVGVDVRTGPEGSAMQHHGSTCLMIAAEMNHRKVASFLVDKEAEVNTVDNQGDTAALRAAKKGLPKMVKLLQKHGAVDCMEYTRQQEGMPVNQQLRTSGYAALNESMAIPSEDAFFLPKPRVAQMKAEYRAAAKANNESLHGSIFGSMRESLPNKSQMFQSYRDASSSLREVRDNYDNYGWTQMKPERAHAYPETIDGFVYGTGRQEQKDVLAQKAHQQYKREVERVVQRKKEAADRQRREDIEQLRARFRPARQQQYPSPHREYPFWNRYLRQAGNFLGYRYDPYQ